jgi:serine/threonine-protein kinase HipA
LEVARQLKTKIVAVDLHQLYLDELTEAARREGLDHFVETRCASMDDLNEPAASIDLIWAEGAAYNIGVENALNLWRPLLRRGGAIAFTELTWLTDDPPAEAVTFWAAAYADMTTVAANRLRVKRAGYEVLSSFALPVDDWKAYYDPLRRRLAELQPQAHGRPELADVIHATEEEIRIFEEFGDHYGYVFFIARGPEL